MTNYVNVRGVIVEQAFQKMPLLEWTYTDFEKNYDVDAWHQWSKDTWPHVPLALCAVYLVGIFGGKYYMQDKKVSTMSLSCSGIAKLSLTTPSS